MLVYFSAIRGISGQGGNEYLRPAEPIILLNAAWRPQLDGEPLNADEETMQLYLAQEHYYRGVMSQFLDTREDRRWCIAEDELYGVCPRHHSDRRLSYIEFSLSETIPSPSSPTLDLPPQSSPRGVAKPSRSR